MPKRKPFRRETVIQYLKLIRKEFGKDWLYRGDPKDYGQPIPGIDRPPCVQFRENKNPPWSRREHEEWLLKEFWKAAIGQEKVERLHSPNTIWYDTWDFVAMARHRGLATRLLDWTKNPLAALFFAVEKRKKKDAVVWCYKHEGDRSWINKQVYPFGPLEVQEIVPFDPPHVDVRITVQSGCFTVHPDHDDPTKPPWQGELRKVIIPQTSRASIRRELNTLAGLTKATLVPDLDGIASHINWRFSE